MINVSERTSAFQGLRLIFIVDIVFFHAHHEFLGGGITDCSFFFILSGFLYRKRDTSYISYLWVKIKKIWPPYFFCMLLLFLGFYLKGTFYKLHFYWDFIPHLLLIQSWFPTINAMKYLGQSWFISSLFFCYCIAPLMYNSVNTEGRKNVLIFIFTTLLLLECVIITSNSYQFWLTYIAPIVRGYEFLLGMQLKHILKDVEYTQDSKMCMISGGCIIAYFFALRYIECTNYSLLHLIIIGWLWTFKSSFVNKILGNSYIVYLSDSCLFIYLIHGIPLRFIGQSYLGAIISIFIGLFFWFFWQYIQKLINAIIISNGQTKYYN